MPRPTMLSGSKPIMGRCMPRPSASLRKPVAMHLRSPPRKGPTVVSSDAGQACWARALLPGLKAIGRLEAQRTMANGKTETDTRYVALSRKLTADKLAEVMRAHWGIENQLNWILDVVFDEDAARTRKDYGPENLAVIRRLAQNILRMHPSDDSISRKMRRASWSKDFFFEIFAHMR